MSDSNNRACAANDSKAMTYKTTHNNNHFMAVCPRLPRRNIHRPTILIIIQSLSASSIYHDP